MTKRIPAATPEDQLSGWQVRRGRIEETDEIFWEVTYPREDGTKGVNILPNFPTLSEFRRALTRFSGPPEGDALARLLSAPMRNDLIAVTKPGWRGRTFVAPNFAIGPDAARYVWHGATSSLGLVAGSYKEWRRVLDFGKESDFVILAVLCPLSAALLRFAGISEAPLFHVVGKGGVGKTTLAAIAASIQGSASSLSSWATSERALEERLGSANDHMLVLNAAEKIDSKKGRQVLTAAIHGITEGQGSRRSASVQLSLPNIDATCVTLSTGNLSGRGLSEKFRMTWEEQEATRFISLPVPSRRKGGIFNRTKLRGAAKQEYAQSSVKQIAEIVKRNYGHLHRRWVGHLVAAEISEVEIQNAIEAFTSGIKPGDNVESRLGEKFGLLFAAGRIARKAELLPWSEARMLRSLRRLYKIAEREARGGRDEATLLKMFSTLAEQAQQVHAEGVQNGDIILRPQQQAFGVRLEFLRTRWPKGWSQAEALSWMRSCGLIKVKGRKSTQQIGASRKRYLLIDHGKVTTLMKSAVKP